jgi:hypothetical protein
MSTTTHKVAAVLSMAFAGLILAAVFASAAHHSYRVASGTTPTKAPSIADIDW